MGHVTKNVGGIYETPKSIEEEGVVYEPTPRNLQKDAVTFLNTQLFSTPKWLLDQSVLSKIRPDQGVNSILGIQESTLNNLLSGERMTRMIETNNRFPSSYSVDELMTDVRSGIYSELKTKSAIDTYRRNLQKAFAEKLIAALTASGGSPAVSFPGFGVVQGAVADPKKSDISSLVRAHATMLKADIAAALPLTTDKMSKYHLQDVLFRLTKALDPK
jgi:hypothetical protein